MRPHQKSYYVAMLHKSTKGYHERFDVHSSHVSRLFISRNPAWMFWTQTFVCSLKATVTIFLFNQLAKTWNWWHMSALYDTTNPWNFTSLHAGYQMYVIKCPIPLLSSEQHTVNEKNKHQSGSQFKQRSQ